MALESERVGEIAAKSLLKVDLLMMVTVRVTTVAVLLKNSKQTH